ncbi:glycoside hydrolase family 37 [Spirochaeta thermophila DSM 6578]|uniref:Glycoside hydrolase family 37 n=1 Tax=Winmispira thermophila (strain ATCC 700085 / DSM 6578 / Z-1203) TaxID=869211 RepID=G0GG46_WINT7|nr:trehalase family glycosidase [Spirochaeta thermophila]AEJ62522.1 glycoside hydrolase family 37 [Spirochaeta thermophila DSM 6578]
MIDSKFPQVHLYDQDLVDLYNQTWALIADFWKQGQNGWAKKFFIHPEADLLSLFESALSTFFLVYSNNEYPAHPQMDNLYRKQEENGAIRAYYDVEEGAPFLTPDNPEGLAPPLLAWTEHNLYHKIGNKKRIKEVMPYLQKYFTWLEATCKDDSGLYHAPLSATMIPTPSRKEAYYPVDFNALAALNAWYMAELGDLLNDKELSFFYRKHYFALKTRINNLMWDEETGFYYDLDKDQRQLPHRTLGAFWTLLAQIPNEGRAERLISYLRDPKEFGTPNPFPTISASDPLFSEEGNGPCGSVYPCFTFMVIKGLELYKHYELAREAAFRHLYFILDTLYPDEKTRGDLWEAYKPTKEGPAIWEGHPEFPRKNFLPYVALATITLMIENVIGLSISLPRKTVDWIIPALEIMGIENLSLKRNYITILTNKNNMGWEVRLESEKLYYFTIDILGKKRKTLPIPSGKCSILIDKI